MRLRVWAVCLLLFWPLAGQGSEVLISSWNIQNLGWGDQKNYEALARVGGQFDLIAVQEVMTREGLYAFHDALEKETSEVWGKIYSHRIGRGSYQEKYAFVFRESRVQYIDGAVVYLDMQDHFARQPYAARFQTSDGANRFVAATVHILYGQSKSDRLPEIRALSEMWSWLEESFPEDDTFILLGDFNLRPTHPAFRPLLEHATPMITRGATTLSTIDGRFANLYDNILLGHRSRLEVLESGIFRFPAELRWTHEQARRHASDHAPVFIRVRSPGPFPARRLGDGRISPAPSRQTDPAPDPGGEEIRGNRNSRIYHHPGCPGFDAISERNRVRFGSEANAQTAGYRRARNCDWD